jgi:hypothetical protein
MKRYEIDGDPLTWWRAGAQDVEAHMRIEGGVVIDGPGLGRCVQTFQRFADAVCGPLTKDNPEHDHIEDDPTATVNRPTPFSKSQKLLWHNENTFARNWPRRIMFACEQVGQGGQTPTVDMAEVYDRLRTSTREAFRDAGVTYVRRLGMDVGLPWQQIYGTSDPAVAERRCDHEKTEWSWDERGGVLTTNQRRPAVITEPASRRLVFIAQVLHWHPRALSPDVFEALSTIYSPSEFPKTCTFGDGSSIPDDFIDELIEVCAELEHMVEWQPDRAIALNNLRRSHARNPYSGDRRLLVAIGDPASFEEFACA